MGICIRVHGAADFWTLLRAALWLGPTVGILAQYGNAQASASSTFSGEFDEIGRGNICSNSDRGNIWLKWTVGISDQK